MEGIEQEQGFIVDSHIPPIKKDDGSYATISLQKAEMLSSHFTRKMNVEEPLRSTPKLPEKTKFELEDIQITEEEAFRVLKTIESHKATTRQYKSTFAL